MKAPINLDQTGFVPKTLHIPLPPTDICHFSLQGDVSLLATEQRPLSASRRAGDVHIGWSAVAQSSERLAPSIMKERKA